MCRYGQSLKNMVISSLFIGQTAQMGRGVFTSEPLEAGMVIERSPVVVMSAAERVLLDQTLLHDYIFEWGESSERCCMALGYVAVYNHACPANCEYEMDFDDASISISTVRDIAAGEELFINYHGNWDDPKELWFAAI